jgi:hypothetical protein
MTLSVRVWAPVWRRRAWRALGVLLLGASSPACDDPLVDPAVVAGPRILGARVRALDTGAAEPGAGESAVIDWLVASNRSGSYSARLLFCVAEPTSLGAPRCAGPVLLERTLAGAFGEALTFELSVPAELAPGASWLAWLGSCEGGEVSFDASASEFSCSDAGLALGGWYRGRIPVGAPNSNPSLADDLLSIDGIPWLEPDTAVSLDAALSLDAACADSQLPKLVAGVTSRISFELGGDDREALESEPGTYAAHPRESLVYTHLLSRPGLERAFSAIDFDSDAFGFDVAVQPSEAAMPDALGETVELHWLVRDERGGVDWTRRRACLLPR